MSVAVPPRNRALRNRQLHQFELTLHTVNAGWASAARGCIDLGDLSVVGRVIVTPSFPMG